ncbi:hypothetical protein HY632_01585 [Candidatus Uhrbacteria bacterium]|nr:hypothetical protein [Candidatus Uhrbacteria bacterium]
MSRLSVRRALRAIHHGTQEVSVLGFRAWYHIAATTGVLGLTVVAAFAGALPVGASTAADLTRGGLTTTAGQAGLGTTATTLPDFVGRLIYGALSISGVVFVVLIVYAGFLWMQARGHKEDIEKAKKIIENAIIGIIITAIAFAITDFVLGRIIAAQLGDSP